jgi:molybdopterin synthase sulfur carrier subunit
MSIRVLLPNAFLKHTGGAREHSSRPGTSTSWSTSWPAHSRACHPSAGRDGKLRGFINVYVNEEDIRFLGDETRVSL